MLKTKCTKNAELSQSGEANTSDLQYKDNINNVISKGKTEKIKQYTNVDAEPVYIPEAHYNKKLNETRPRIPYSAAAGSLSISGDSVNFSLCDQIPVVHSLPRYDFTILAYGDSMLPEYHSGDELAALLIKESAYVQWGRVYILDTAQGIVVKRIFDDGDYILCRSDNPNYGEFRILKTDIYNIALVVGMLRRY